jgi:4-amino-4-deoxy-L-arabinose transferase-like glycosyltransferase
MVTRLAARNGGRAGLAALVAILLLGVGLRVDYAWEGRAPVYDAAAYARIAANLDEGRGFTAGKAATQPSSNYSPGLPLLVTGAYEVSGGVHERLARTLLALIGSLAVLFTYLIGRRLSGPTAGLIGAAAVTIYPALLEYQGMLMGEPLAATLLSGAVLAMLWAAGERMDPLPGNVREARDMQSGSCAAKPRSRIGAKAAGRATKFPGRGSTRSHHARWLVPGVLVGATAMVRPEYLGVAVLLALVVFVRGIGPEWRRSLVQGAILLAGVVLIVAPWTVRNAVALNRFVPISTGGGQVLFAGTYLPSGGDPEKVGAEVVARHPGIFDPADLHRLRLEQILARLAAQRYPALEADQALSRMGREQLWDDISEEPLEFAGFLATKVGRIWSHGPRDIMREPLWEALHWALVTFGLLGLAVLTWRRRWEALLLMTILLSITALSAILVASPRRVLVMLPLVAALAGVGATFAWTALRQARRPEQSRRARAG